MPYVPSRRGWPESAVAEPGESTSSLPADHPAPPAKSPRRPRRRLRILLGLNALVALVYGFSQLDPSTAKMLGPTGEYVFDLLHAQVGLESISPAGKRLKAAARAMGGEAIFVESSHRYFGLFGAPEQFHVRLNQGPIGDAELADLVKNYGELIWALDLRNTRVSDQGLRHLQGLSSLQQLTLGNDAIRFQPPHPIPVSPITDAGLVHLKGLTQLMHLDLSGLPITDSGLDALTDLPQLVSLYLNRTKIKGEGLARLKSLRSLVLLYLDDGELTDSGASVLAGASSLQLLSVRGVPLTAKGLKGLTALPRLQQLDLTGCGLLDEEVESLKASVPGVKITR